VISEGSCDTEDWSNDAENHRNKLHFTVYSHRKQFLLYFCSNKLSLGEQKRQKIVQNCIVICRLFSISLNLHY